MTGIESRRGVCLRKRPEGWRANSAMLWMDWGWKLSFPFSFCFVVLDWVSVIDNV